MAVSILAAVGYLSEKIPKVIRYLRQPVPTGLPRAKSDYVLGSALALACAGIWAASYASIDLLSPAVGTLATNIHLMGFAALFLYIGSVIATRFKPVKQPIEPRKGGQLAVLVIANLGNFVFSVWALTFISASEAMTLNNLSPLLLAAGLWWRGKLAPSIGTFLALVLVVLGAFLVNVDGNFTLRTGDHLQGGLIAIAAGASFALWTFTLDEFEFASKAERMSLLALVFFVSYVVLVTYGFFTNEQSQPTARDYLILILNGARVGLVHMLYLFAIEKAGPMLASVIVVLMVPLTFPFDSVWNQASITIQLVLGSILIVLAAAGLLSDELRRRPAPDDLSRSERGG